jgi:hypothetical protein
MGEQILSSILAHYQFPDETFVGSPESIQTLKQALDRRSQWNQMSRVESQRADTSKDTVRTLVPNPGG